jgi:hypothetical protein
LFLPGDRWDLSNHIFRSGAFLQNLPALHRRFSGLISPRKPCLPHPGCLVRVEAACSHGLSGLSGSLCLPPIQGASLSSNVPLVLRRLPPSRGEATGTPGIYDREASAFPVTGRRPVWPSDRLRLPPFRKINCPRTIFSSRSPCPLTKTRILLLANNCLPPNGRWHTVSVPHSALCPAQSYHSKRYPCGFCFD